MQSSIAAGRCTTRHTDTCMCFKALSCESILICPQLPPSQYMLIAGDATVKGYTKLINKSGAYTEIANTGTDEKRCKEL